MRGRNRLIAALLGLALLFGLVALRYADPALLRSARDSGFDLYQQLEPRAGGDFPVLVVDIDEASLARFGQWPWPRDRLATLLERLTALGAATVAFDFVFSEPDRTSPRLIAQSLPSAAFIADLPDHDAQFADMLQRSPSVLALAGTPRGASAPPAPKSGLAVVGPDPTQKLFSLPFAAAPLPVLANATQGFGTVNLSPADTAEVIRRVPLAIRIAETVYPSLAVEALRVAQGAQTLLLFGDDQARLASIRAGQFEAPTASDGLFWVYYRPYDATENLSARELLAEDYPALAERVAGRIVFVGTSAEGLLDIRATPLGENVPGVAIHAQIVEQMLTEKFLTRADWVSQLEIAAFILFGLATIIAMLRAGPRVSLLIGAIFFLAWGAIAWTAFRQYGVLIDWTYPLGGGFALYAAMLFFQFTIADADKRQIRRAFGHYVAPGVLSAIEKSGRVELGGEERDLSIMFIDVRNYTTISESMTPHALVSMLNRMFEALGAEITASLGTIDKFIGDAIMAFWNAPLDVERHALRACEAALKARAALDKLNEGDGFGLRASGNKVPELRIGIGIATGSALVGNMGLSSRFDYSCVGDVVNVASRVEGACKALHADIAVTEETRDAASELAFLYAGALGLKGKSEREGVYVLAGDAALAGSPQFAELAAAHDRLITALHAGAGWQTPLADCAHLAATLAPRLVDFYSAMPGRLGDFAPAAAPEAALANA